MLESITRKARQFEPANWLASIFLTLVRRSGSYVGHGNFPFSMLFTIFLKYSLILIYSCFNIVNKI